MVHLELNLALAFKPHIAQLIKRVHVKNDRGEVVSTRYDDTDIYLYGQKTTKSAETVQVQYGISVKNPQCWLCDIEDVFQNNSCIVVVGDRLRINNYDYSVLTAVEQHDAQGPTNHAKTILDLVQDEFINE